MGLMDSILSLILIIITAIFVNNVVLAQFLGICPFLGVSKKTETAAGMGGAVIFVITIATFVTQLIYRGILAITAGVCCLQFTGFRASFFLDFSSRIVVYYLWS